MDETDRPAASRRGGEAARAAVAAAIDLVTPYADLSAEGLEAAARNLAALLKACQALKGVNEALELSRQGNPDEPTDIESELRLRRALYERIAALVAARRSGGGDGDAEPGRAEGAGGRVAGDGARGTVA